VPIDNASEIGAELLRIHGAFRGYIPPLSQAWLIDALLRDDIEVDEETHAWLRDFAYSGAPSVLRVRALLALAAHRLVSAQELSRFFDTAATSARPDIAAALAICESHSDAPAAATAVLDAEPLLRNVHSAALARLPSLDWI
jgi:hypothetical protein